MYERHSNFGGFLTGLLLGGVLGYAVAMLNAPRRGVETRQMLSEKGREIGDRAKETMQTTVDKTGKLVSEGRDRIGTTIGDTRERVQERVSDLKTRGGSVVTDVREQVSDKLRGAADQVDPS